MKARPYSEADLPLLQETFSRWIANAGRCGYDHVGELPHRIHENLRGRRPVGDLVQLWETGSEIVGLTICLRFESAFDVYVAPHVRGGSEERHLLTHAFETTARLLPADASHVLTDAFDGDTTRIELLTELGFERFRVWDDVNERRLDLELEVPAVPAGFTVRSARLDDADGLASARNSAFDEDWTGPQYRAQVMEKPGYSPAREIVAEAPDGRIAAFAVTWEDRLNRTGHVEPVGTHGEFRRRGLARAVMVHAMKTMRGHGMTAVTVNHNAENVAARALYRSLGFERRFETYGFRRPRPGR